MGASVECLNCVRRGTSRLRPECRRQSLRRLAIRRSKLNSENRDSRIRFGIAVRGGNRVPFVCFCQVLLHTHAAFVKHGKIELRVGQAQCRCLAEPHGSFDVILRLTRSLGESNGKIVYRFQVALLCSEFVPVSREPCVRRNAAPAFIEGGKSVLRNRLSLLRCTRKPARRFGFIGCNAVAFQVAKSEQQFGLWVARVRQRDDPLERCSIRTRRRTLGERERLSVWTFTHVLASFGWQWSSDFARTGCVGGDARCRQQDRLAVDVWISRRRFHAMVQHKSGKHGDNNCRSEGARNRILGLVSLYLRLLVTTGKRPRKTGCCCRRSPLEVRGGSTRRTTRGFEIGFRLGQACFLRGAGVAGAFLGGRDLRSRSWHQIQNLICPCFLGRTSDKRFGRLLRWCIKADIGLGLAFSFRSAFLAIPSGVWLLLYFTVALLDRLNADAQVMVHSLEACALIGVGDLRAIEAACDLRDRIFDRLNAPIEIC